MWHPKRFKRPLVWLLLFLVAGSGCGGSYSSGDRVLVFKSDYDAGLNRPQRYEVVVFRCPATPQRGGPLDNFIKRLLALGGETLAIFFGHLFVTTDWQPPEDLDDDHAALDPRQADPLQLWKKEYMYHNDARARDLFQTGRFVRRDGQQKTGRFRILRKDPALMLALRRLVYDHDFPARDLEACGFPPRWQPAAGWQVLPQEHAFRSTGQNRDLAWVHYQHILRPLDWPTDGDPVQIARILQNNQRLRPQLITDFSGYNSYETPGRQRDLIGGNWVGDLMLDFELTVERPEGEFWLELARGVDRFQACWELASGRCTLWRLTDGQRPVSLASADTPLRGPGTYHVRFANFDERLTVWVEDTLPFGKGVDYPSSWYFDPDKKYFVHTGPTENDLKPASFGSKGAVVTLRHVQLWRNTYYTLARENATTAWDADLPFPPEPRDLVHTAAFWEHFWSTPSEWEPLRKLEVATWYVQPGHYLCLGDNSPESSDSRSWGAVPERLLLGRALLVYHPFARAGLIR